MFFLFPAAVDVERITRDMDFQALQDNLEQITLCNIDAEVVSFTVRITEHVSFLMKNRTHVQWIQISLNYTKWHN